MSERKRGREKREKERKDRGSKMGFDEENC